MDTNSLLSVLKKTVRGIMPSRVSKDIVVGIDIGAAMIKVVQLKKERGQIVLDTYGEIATGPYAKKQAGEIVPLDPELLTTAVVDVLREANITAKYAGISIQSAASLVFILTVPAVAEKDVAGMVASEARKYIPVPTAEVSLDWWVVPQPDAFQNSSENLAHTEVLVAAIRNEQLEMYKTMITATPVQSSFFEIEVFSAMRASLKNELSAVVLVDLGASATRVSILQYGVVKQFRTIKHGGYQVTEQLRRSLGLDFDASEEAKKKFGVLGNAGNGGEKVSQIVSSEINSIFREVERIIGEYEREHNHAVAKMILLGGGARTPGITGIIANVFNGEVSFSDPFAKVQNPPFLDEALAATGPEFAVATGLALRSFL